MPDLGGLGFWRTAAAKRLQVLVAVPELIDVDAAGLQDIRGQREVETAWRRARLLYERLTFAQVVSAVVGVHMDFPSDDQHIVIVSGWYDMTRLFTEASR